MKTYSHVARAVLTRPWAIDRNSPEWAAIMDVVSHRVAGNPYTEDEIRDRLQAAARPRMQTIGAQTDEERQIAILPIYGVLLPRSNLMLEMSGGGASVAQLSAAFAEAVNDESVASIILDIDSPGGSVGGIPEFAAQIFAARDVKPVAAIADSMAASAGYWLGSQASEFSVTPSGWVGSIGVFTEHENWAAFWEQVGMDHTFVQYGDNKTGGNEFEPLSDHERERMQSIVDYFGKLFDADVAKGRGVKAKVVRDTYGQGDMFAPTEAVELGMADRVETLGDVIGRLSQPPGRRARGSSAMGRAGGAYATIDVAHADPAAADPDVLEAVEQTDPVAEAAAFEVEMARIAAQRRRRRPA